MRARRTLLVALTTALATMLAVLIPATASAAPPGEPEFANSSVEVRNCDGRNEIFSLINKQLYHQWEFTPGGHDYSERQPLGGSGRLVYEKITAQRNWDCRLEVFGVGDNHQAYHIWQLTAGTGDWSPFHSLGGGFDSPVTVGKNKDGRLEVFGVGETGRMYHAWQKTRGGEWTGWYSLGLAPEDRPFVITPWSPGVGYYDDGSLFVRMWDIEGWFWEKYQWTPGGEWIDHWVGCC